MVFAADNRRSSSPSSDGPYVLNDAGIFAPHDRTIEAETAYEAAGCQGLADIQNHHFWYLGRHRFLLRALRGLLRNQQDLRGGAAIDLGGGCGGWIHYLLRHEPNAFGELALGDASSAALDFASELLPESIGRYQIDALDLMWRDRWDVVFLLDVLEHIPQDAQVLEQIKQALRPGGVLIVSCPSFQWLWSYIDDLSGHKRRYTKRDFRELADQAELQLLDNRYFNTFLGPALVLSRLRTPAWIDKEPQRARAHLEQKQRIPVTPLNQLLHGVFALETPLGHWIPFPWGTSVMGIFRRTA